MVGKGRNKTAVAATAASMALSVLVMGQLINAQPLDEINPEQVTVEITTEQIEPEWLTPVSEVVLDPVIAGLNENDKETLLRICMAEAEGESVEGKALVMNVVLNRVRDSRWPDSVSDVVFEKNQFSTTKAGGRFYTTVPNDECYEALELVLSGQDESQGALFFESCSGESWQSRNLEFLFKVGRHRFYR